MRVIGGHDRGRRLRAPRGLRTRPTADRVRETLFDVLGPAVAGTRVLDLFAGTGAVGIERLSRGAARGVLVERDPAAPRGARGGGAGATAPTCSPRWVRRKAPSTSCSSPRRTRPPSPRAPSRRW